MSLYDSSCMYFFILCSFASATTLSSPSLVGPFLPQQIVSPYAVLLYRVHSITRSCCYCPIRSLAPLGSFSTLMTSAHSL